jgi:hypothetical protein
MAAFASSRVPAEITVWSRGWSSNDGVIDEVDLKNSAGFVDPTGEPQIGFGEGRVRR